MNNIKRIIQIIVIIVINIIFLSSCGRSIYSPTTPNIPLFNNSNELHLESTIYANGLNLKTAYSPINNLSMQINGQYFNDNHVSNGPQYHKYIECALGTYQNFYKKYFLELYAGYGQGVFNFGDPFYGGDDKLVLAKGNYNKEYCQLNVGITNNNSLIGGCLRVGKIRNNYEYANWHWLTGNTYNHLSIEPYIFLRTSVKRKLSFVSYIGFTFIEGDNITIRTNFLNMGIGVSLNLGRKFEN